MKQKILLAAVKVAEKRPLYMVTRGAIAKRAKVAPSLVSWYLGTMDELRASVVALAVETNNAAVVASAMIAHHPGVKNVSGELKQAALKFLAV